MTRVRTFTRYTFSLLILLTLATFGCGSGNDTPYLSTAVSKTQNPLVANYQVTTSVTGATVWVEFGTDQTYGRATSQAGPTPGPYKTLNLFVAGMKPSTTYHMRAHVDWDGGSSIDQDHTFTTGALPTKPLSQAPTGALVAPTISVTRPNPNLAQQPGVELMDVIGAANTYTLAAFVTDLSGNIIWYYDIGPGNVLSTIKPLANGHFLLNMGNFGSNPALPSNTLLREIDLAGNMITEVTSATVNQQLQSLNYDFTIGGFHHDVLELPNGHWIVLGSVTKAFTNLPGYPGVTNVNGDALIDLDQNRNVAWAWNAFDHLDVNRHPYLFPDWTHSNAILYTQNDGNLLVSMRHQNWILKIDYNNGIGAGDVVWRLGYQGDFQFSEDPSEWFFAQHFPSINSINGEQLTLTIFDNGDDRYVDNSNFYCGINGNPPCYSRAVIFQLNESSMAANLMWADTPGAYSYFGGGAQTLANNNVEFDLCAPSFTQSIAQINEVTQVANPQVVWQLNLTGGNAYRGYRIPSLYPGVSWSK
jgi:arylsulfate sulfotransferase